MTPKAAKVTVELSDAVGNMVASSVGNPTLLRDIAAPTFASGTTASVVENTSAATMVYDANAKNGGGNDVGITYSLGGVDAALFGINTSTGALTFNSSPDYEAPPNAYWSSSQWGGADIHYVVNLTDGNFGGSHGDGNANYVAFQVL